MAKAHALVVHKSLISWIISKNTRLQVVLVITAIFAVFANVFPLEMQRRIINDAINLRKFDLLVFYCGLYLIAVTAASMLKYLINILQNIIGQRTLADMRKALYAHILTIPLSFYRTTQPGMVVGALTTELATAGDFVGMAIAIPVTNLLMLLAFAGYLFWLNPLLAAVTLSIYPVVILLVSVLQKRVNIYNRKRVNAGRKVSSKVGESIAGIHEIQANGAFSIENKKFASIVDHLRKIRIIWNLYRLAVKTINSLFTNFSRLLVFALGGYLAINGRLELGALVAFLSAQEKLYDPWKELIQFYQAYQTASVTYSRTMEYFNVEPQHQLVPKGRQPYELEGSIEVNDLSFVVEDGTQLLSEINFDLNHGEHMALVGFSGSGKSTLAQCIAQLYKYTGGKILIDQKEVSQLSKADITHSIGFVSQTPFIFEGSIDENLLYAVMAKAEKEPADGQPKMPSLDDRILVLQQTGLFIDVLRFGLNTVLDKNKHKDIIGEILDLRKTFQQDYGEDLAEFIEFYDPNIYLYNSSVAVFRYVRSLASQRHEQHSGHNPLGSWSVIAMLASVVVQAASGLFADDDIMTTGPLWKYVSDDVASVFGAIHETNALVLLTLICLHMGAILFYLVKKKENLIIPMLTGLKDSPDTHIESLRPGQGILRALIVLIVCGALTYSIVNF